MELKDRLVLQLTKNPGQKASELATKLRADRKEINRILVTELNDRFEQDNSYRWNLILPTSHDESMKSHSGISDTPLSRLCRYYLACLGQDDLEEVSTWARSRYDYDYVELNTVPLGEIDRLLQKPEVSSLLATTRGDHLTKILYLGYPVCIHTFTSRSGDLIYRLEPVLFLPVQFDQPRNRGNASLSIDYPMINTSVLKRYSNSDRESLMGELVQLEEELGYMNSNPEVPELDEVAHRLYSIRKEWPWRERCDGGLLRNIPLINELDEPGIYNRAVLMSAERRPYTEGLEIELQHLSNLKESAYSHSILGNLVNGNIPERESVTNELHPLLEVLPMNEEQRQAINRSLTEPLTIITGPPGTGKSQVVTNLLINAAWQGKKVLFASKNNKAVDVVEIRVNSLGSRPILMRMGSGEYYQKLCDHIQGLLSTTSDTEQIQEYESTLAKYQDSKRKMEEINSEFDRVIEMRNKVDKLEQSVEHLRDEFGPDITQHIRSNLNKNWREQFSTFYKALSQNDKSKQSLFGRLLWPFIRKSRFAKLENVFHSIQKGLSEIGLSSNINLTEDTKLDYYYDLANNINFRLCEVEKISDYFQALVDLQTAESFESINKKKRQLFDEVSDNSKQLWTSWLKIHASNVFHENRQLLTQYAAALKMIIESGDGRTSSKVTNKFHSLHKSVSKLLPCWAVTSLSARGKLPFISGYYDLVVIDEASQCDIASALPLLYRAKSAVIIGDRQQLSHISRIQKRQDQQLLERFGLVDHFLHWAYATNSLFEMTHSFAKSDDTVNLRDHHRSHADIINFSNKYFYEGYLRIATNYERLKMPKFGHRKTPAVRWIDVKGQTIRPTNGSAINPQEATTVIDELIRLFLEQGYQGTVGVVSPFRAQANLIRERFAKNDDLYNLMDQSEFLSDTVHRFQGDERDIMVFSPVISKGAQEQTISFLRSERNLFNVAITRARASLVVVGDLGTTKQCGVDYLEKFASYVEELEERTKEKTDTSHFSEFGPRYPQSIDRARVSDWEIILYEALYGEGIRTFPQYPVEQYKLDLAVVKGARQLDIEVDGERYHKDWTGELCRKDQIRNQRLYELGWDVLRFWVYEVRDDLDNCVNRVKCWVEKVHDSSNLPP